jgi:hydroxyquinol 1,2-dioxygenase
MAGTSTPPLHPKPTAEPRGPAATSTVIDEHLRQVLGTLRGSPDPRLAEMVEAAVRHLHAFVKEVGLTPTEWRAGVDFLTSVGHFCRGDRQELILLSDALGVSTLLELVNEGRPFGATEPTVLGPFYVEGAPARSFGDSIVDDPSTGGEPLVLHGEVRDIEGRPIPGATVEVWQVQPNRRYDIEEDPQRRNLRGTFTARADGRYRIRTVRPVDYTVPEDGPVGHMLHALGRDSWRPAHIHLKVSAEGYRSVVTHVFDSVSPWLDRDVVFGVRQSLIASMDGGQCRFDLVLDEA